MESAKVLIKDQTALMEQLNRFIINWKKSPKERLESSGYLERRLKQLNDLWKEFAANDRQIRILADSETEKTTYFKGDDYLSFEESFFTYQGIISDAIHDIMHKRSTISQSPSLAETPRISESDNMVLPRINIPKFHGDYNSWTSFHDLFESLIHKNEKIPNVQKLHYLRSVIEGDAENLIKHLAITEANYLVAWQTLCKRYTNKRIIVNSQLRSLFAQSHVSNENSVHIRKLLDTSNTVMV